MEKLIGEIKKILADNNYYYVSNEIENGLGLEQIIPNFVFVCKGNPDVAKYLEKDGFKVIKFESGASSFELIEQLIASGQIDNTKANYFQTFKISPQFERAAVNVNGKLINTNANLNRIFEGKISQSRIFEHAGVSTPRTIVEQLGKFNYDDLKNTLGNKFVIQFDRGHTGLGTNFIENEQQFNELKNKFPNRMCRISELINGNSYTVNGCVTPKGIYLAGLNYQITGIPELTSERGGTVGNDFVHGLSDAIIQKLYTEARKLEGFLNQNNYRGLIGFDFMVDQNSNVKIIEINARQPRSVPFSSQIQVINNQIPLNLLHIAAFLGIRVEEDPLVYSIKNCQSFEASQIFVRNIGDDDFKITQHIDSGEYKFGSSNQLEFSNTNYRLSELDKNNIVVLARQLGEIIDHGGEIARIQTRNSALINNELNPDFLNTLVDLRAKLGE